MFNDHQVCVVLAMLNPALEVRSALRSPTQGDLLIVGDYVYSYGAVDEDSGRMGWNYLCPREALDEELTQKATLVRARFPLPSWLVLPSA